MPLTLSAGAKDALARGAVEAPHCRTALRDGLAVYGGTDGIFRTSRATIARLMWSLQGDPPRHPVRRVAGTRLQRLPAYEIDIVGDAVAPSPPRARCDRRMELRAAFLACGSLSAPARGYHLEFVPPSEAARARLAALLRAEGLHPKLAAGGRRQRLYFKDIDEISRCLAAIGSSRALLHLEDVRALKETKNRIRRLVNTEAANADRAAGAAAAQARSIALVADAFGLRNLRAPLREIAELRLQHPSETLAELGRRCSPPAGKSTVNGRIAALLRLAERLERTSHAAPAE